MNGGGLVDVLFVLSTIVGLVALLVSVSCLVGLKPSPLRLAVLLSALAVPSGVWWSAEGAYRSIVLKHPTPVPSAGLILYPCILAGVYLFSLSDRQHGFRLEVSTAELTRWLNILAWLIGFAVATASCAYV